MFVYKKNPVGFELWHVKTFFYSKQFAKLLTTWLKTIYSSLEGVNKKSNTHTFNGPYLKKKNNNNNTPCFPSNILSLRCFLVPKIVQKKIVQSKKLHNGHANFWR